MRISALSVIVVRVFIEIDVRSGLLVLLNGEMVISWISRGPSIMSGADALLP